MTYTRGNIIIENINIGDIHYEFERDCGVKVKVVTLPVRNDDGLWTWTSENVKTGSKIDYSVNEEYSSFGPKLYDYEAYKVNRWL